MHPIQATILGVAEYTCHEMHMPKQMTVQSGSDVIFHHIFPSINGDIWLYLWSVVEIF